ncbi:DUF814 domain-containing protein [bacterium]|nr:DUF814 domain-containing protein [bacterium]
MNAFSTDKHEIYLLFDLPLALRIQFYKGEAYFQSIEFENIQKTNRLPAFERIHDLKVEDVQSFDLDRQFYIQFERNRHLHFHLFGKFSQISAYIEGEHKSHFPFKSKPIEIQPENELKRADYFNTKNLDELSGAIRFLKSKDLDQLASLNYDSNRYEVWQKFLKQFKNYQSSTVREKDSKIEILPGKDEEGNQFDDLLDALTFFTSRFISRDSFQEKQKQALQNLHRDEQILQDRKRKLNQSLKQVKAAMGYKAQADLIMAYMHEVKQGMSSVELPSFEEQKPVKIKLKKDLSPQANAERLYRKSKNEATRLKYLERSLNGVESELGRIEERRTAIEEAEDHRSLRKAVNFTQESKQEGKRLPYKSYTIDGFEVRVGKSAKDNDELLRSYSAKHDLWFHARAVSGSHIILRLNKNQIVPESTIEKVASLAAFNSKALHENLAAVIYTERRYVRKPRKALPGQVLVEREEVVLVEPLNISELQ